MGCGPSQPARRQGHTPPRNQATNRPAAHATAATGSSRVPRALAGPASPLPHRTNKVMTAAIRAEFLAALHKAFGALDYGVIGGTALAEFGNARATSDIDVMVPHGISEVIEPQLLARGMVRTVGGGLGYVASDGNCYGIDFTTDRNIGKIFKGRQDTIQAGRTRACIMPIEFLLDSKAYSYITRAGPDADAKRLNDATDLFFIIKYMREHHVRPDRRRCRWVVDYDFWTMFARAFEGSEQQLRDLGLQRDATPSNSNRTSRRASSGSRTSSSRNSDRR